MDAADHTRFVEAKEEIGRLLEDPSSAQVPVAILGNKIDISVAASEDKLRYSLGLHAHMRKGESSQPVEISMCSIVKRMEYSETFDWSAKLV